MKRARGLVVVRLGQNHHFDSLLAVPLESRSWDLAVSHYDDSNLPDGSIVEWSHRSRGGKWDGIWLFFEENPEAFAAYDFYWLVDDDVQTGPETVNALFDYVRQHDFELAQPALTLDSYYSHRVTLVCPVFRYRHTNLVEIMAPIISRRMLHRIYPIIQHTRSGFGLDWLWCRFVTHPRRQIAIIDELQVRHVRPLRQNLRPVLELQGTIPEVEREYLVNTYQLSPLHGISFAGVKKNGETVHGRLRMAWILSVAYWRQRSRIDKRPWDLRQAAMLIYRQLFAPLGF